MRITNLWRAQHPLILYLAAASNGEFCHNFIPSSNKLCQQETTQLLEFIQPAVASSATFLQEIRDEAQREDTRGTVEGVGPGLFILVWQWGPSPVLGVS